MSDFRSELGWSKQALTAGATFLTNYPIGETMCDTQSLRSPLSVSRREL